MTRSYELRDVQMNHKLIALETVVDQPTALP
jgi:hypothetical protein